MRSISARWSSIIFLACSPSKPLAWSVAICRISAREGTVPISSGRSIPSASCLVERWGTMESVAEGRRKVRKERLICFRRTRARPREPTFTTTVSKGEMASRTPSAIEALRFLIRGDRSRQKEKDVRSITFCC